MTVKYPMKELMKFHEKARKSMKNMEKCIQDLEESGDVAAFESGFIKFFNFCENDLPLHVQDEEHALLPMLRKSYIEEEATDETESVQDILNDHKDVWAAVEAIKLMKKLIGGENQKDKGYIDDIVKKAKSLITVMEDHFSKEERVIFPIVDDTFNQQHMAELAHRMNKIRECSSKHSEMVKSCKAN